MRLLTKSGYYARLLSSRKEECGDFPLKTSTLNRKEVTVSGNDGDLDFGGGPSNPPQEAAPTDPFAETIMSMRAEADRWADLPVNATNELTEQRRVSEAQWVEGHIVRIAKKAQKGPITANERWLITCGEGDKIIGTMLRPLLRWANEGPRRRFTFERRAVQEEEAQRAAAAPTPQFEQEQSMLGPLFIVIMAMIMSSILTATVMLKILGYHTT